MGVPTKEERTKETRALHTWLADTVVISLIVITAILSGSLTMLGEGARGVLMLGVVAFSLWVLYAVHRGRLSRFEYGVSKIERFVWVVVGLSLVVSGLWVAQTVIDTLFAVRPAASPLGLTWAAIINAINTLINVVSWFAMAAASRDDDSDVYRVQLRVRFTMMVSSLALQVTLTVAALAKDDAIALTLDAAGAMFVTCVMVYNGVSMISHALPHLLDAPAPTELSALICGAVGSVVAEEDIVSIRTRRAGPMTYAEVAVAATAFPSMSALRAYTTAVRQALGRHAAKIDIAVVIAPASRGQKHSSEAEEVT